MGWRRLREGAALTYVLGQRVALDRPPGERAITGVGDPRCHALIVRPQTEDSVEDWLASHGIDGWHPVEKRLVVVRGRRVTRTRRYLPGYVFAEFPGPVIWHRVFERGLVVDVVRMRSGRAGRLSPADLVALRQMRSIDAAAQARIEQARRFNVGDSVRIAAGPLEGEECEIVALGHGEAIVSLRMFGGLREVSVSLSSVRKSQSLAR